jgi:hypothetical protein
MGHIQGHSVLILIDSGSSHTFLCSQVALQLDVLTALPKPLIVKVDSGECIDSQWQLQRGQWEVQGCSFVSDFMVLPLQHFDVVLGYDWLEQHNPVKVHWSDKWMVIPYRAGSVKL